MESPSVEVVGAVKRFGPVAAVDGVSLAIGRGELFALLGPSGCGKTTLLRLIAGLEVPDAGIIRLGGVDVTGVPAHRRPVHTVFQQYALFPHLTVAENVGFGLPYLDRALNGTRQRPNRAERAARVGEALAQVRLDGLGDRRPHQLSGGQRQRVALARALVLAPQVLLLDEPLAALDPALRREMQSEIKALQRGSGLTFVLVTHDRDEALALSDRLAVLGHGRIEQIGTPAEVWERPATEFVARFTGADNLFAGEVAHGAGGPVLRLPGGGEVPAPPGAPPGALRFVVRPERLVLLGERTTGALPVIVEDRTYQGLGTTWTVRGPAGERCTVYAPSDGNPAPFPPGATAFLTWDPRHAVVLPAR
jgi:ABC-type Fe3+/spermidine/putrescine transport system ATPase subunit